MFNKSAIEFYMNKKGWTKYRLAKQANIGQSTLSEILSGKKQNPSINTLQKIADALGVSIDYLTGKSVRAIIEDKLNNSDMTIEELSVKTKLPVSYLEKLDDITPDEGDYERIKIIANTLSIDSSILSKSLYRQEPPTYEGPTSSVKEDFTAYRTDRKEEELLSNYRKLNDFGKDKLIEYSSDLMATSKYNHEERKIYTLAAHDDGLTPDEAKAALKKAKEAFRKMDEE